MARTPRATRTTTMVEAKYHGTCPECDDPIEPGDIVVVDEDKEAWVHEECAEGAEATDTHWGKQR